MIKIFAHNNSYGNYAGSYLNECLPNITGTVGHLDDGAKSTFGGAFYNKENSKYDASSSWSSGNGFVLGFDASKSDGIYKNDCKNVRVKSYGVYIWIRTA